MFHSCSTHFFLNTIHLVLFCLWSFPQSFVPVLFCSGLKKRRFFRLLFRSFVLFRFRSPALALHADELEFLFKMTSHEFGIFFLPSTFLSTLWLCCVSFILVCSKQFITTLPMKTFIPISRSVTVLAPNFSTLEASKCWRILFDSIRFVVFTRYVHILLMVSKLRRFSCSTYPLYFSYTTKDFEALQSLPNITTENLLPLEDILRILR